MKTVRLCLLLLALVPATAAAQDGARAALEVISRWTHGTMPIRVSTDLTKDPYGCDRASYRTNNDTLVIEASSPTMACHAFYHWAKERHAGIATWSGSWFDKPANTHTAPTAISTPYRDHQYFNVVTYGYTMPYWDQARWDAEIDWMALHGIDMPLMLLAQEWVYREVFREMGLSDSEIDEWEVGPAHLPWMRMGNLSGNSFDGPLGANWHQQQMALAHHVMDRMRQLEMKPVCPAFGGFVPKALADHYEVALDTTGWDWMPNSRRNYRVRPDSPLFAEIGTRFIRRWEQHFGKGTYYLSDSFNEMEIPSDTALMARYGEAVYSSIRNANPEAVWVMQGWTLGYQRWQWGNGIFSALTRDVPRDRFYLLDMATDYNCCFWKNSWNWDYYNSFDGHPWVWSVIPNMGGKTAYTGVLEHYANGRISAQTSANRGRLTGFGMAPEGLENNELLYELLSDAAHMGATEEIDLERWTRDYLECRYGRKVAAMEDFYLLGLLPSLYAGFQDHPQFGWQVRNNITGSGSVAVDSTFRSEMRRLMTRHEELQAAAKTMNPEQRALMEADLIEITAHYLAGKTEETNRQIAEALDKEDTRQAHRLLDEAEAALLRLDAILEQHPTHRLARWEAQAMEQASTPQERHRNAVNARRIVSVWYGDHQADEPVNDYSCRLWSGLIRDYYLPRMRGTWMKRIDGTPFDQIAFENAFVESAPHLSPARAMDRERLIALLAEMVIGQER